MFRHTSLFYPVLKIVPDQTTSCYGLESSSEHHGGGSEECLICTNGEPKADVCDLRLRKPGYKTAEIEGSSLLRLH